MKTTIHQAILAHQEGRFEEADQFYKTILESQPEHLDAQDDARVGHAARFDRPA